GRDRLRLPYPGNRLVGYISGQVVVRIPRGGNQVAVFVEDGVPMIHISGVKAVEVVEPETVRPAIEGAGRARLPRGRVVVLADPGRHVAVLAQHFAARAAGSRQNAGVSVISRGHLRDPGEGGGVVVATCDQGGSRGAAQRGGMKAVVA